MVMVMRIMMVIMFRTMMMNDLYQVFLYAGRLFMIIMINLYQQFLMGIMMVMMVRTMMMNDWYQLFLYAGRCKHCHITWFYSANKIYSFLGRKWKWCFGFRWIYNMDISIGWILIVSNICEGSIWKRCFILVVGFWWINDI